MFLMTKQTVALKSVQANKSDCCLSLQSDARTLDLLFDSSIIRNKFADCIRALMPSTPSTLIVSSSSGSVKDTLLASSNGHGNGGIPNGIASSDAATHQAGAAKLRAVDLPIAWTTAVGVAVECRYVIISFCRWNWMTDRHPPGRFSANV
jgi:hypothetical protein